MTRYIAIDGKGGSGKTYLSEMLASELGATVYHLDDYGNDYEPFVGISKLLEALTQATRDIVLYEGVGVFDERFDVLCPFRIFVQVPEEIRSGRAASRDIPREDRSEEDWSEIWSIWSEAERKYFTDKVAKKADMTVGVHDGNFDVSTITAKIRAGA